VCRRAGKDDFAGEVQDAERRLFFCPKIPQMGLWPRAFTAAFDSGGKPPQSRTCGGQWTARPAVESWLLGGDAVEAGGAGGLKGFVEVVGAVGEGEALQGSPNGIDEVVRGLDDDGDLGRSGDFEAKLIGAPAEAAVANYRAWVRARQRRQAKNNTPGKPNKTNVSGSGTVVAVTSN